MDTLLSIAVLAGLSVWSPSLILSVPLTFVILLVLAYARTYAEYAKINERCSKEKNALEIESGSPVDSIASPTTPNLERGLLKGPDAAIPKEFPPFNEKQLPPGDHPIGGDIRMCPQFSAIKAAPKPWKGEVVLEKDVKAIDEPLRIDTDTRAQSHDLSTYHGKPMLFPSKLIHTRMFPFKYKYVSPRLHCSFS